MTWARDLIHATEARTRELIADRGLARTLRDRAIPGMRAVDVDRPTRVYYLAPNENSPSGGVRVIYRHVDLLNEIGVPSSVVHSRRGFRCSWFENSTSVRWSGEVELHRNDILVIPEFFGTSLHALPKGPRVLIFNQGAYHTFDHLDLATTTPGAPYAGVPGLLGILTVSEDSERLLSYAFPDVPVFRTRPVVDAAVFHPDDHPGGRQLAFMQSRRGQEREQLLHILRARGVDWKLAPIAGKPEAEVAEVLRASAIFMSFSDRDGFGLPPAEAMASGCYVVGYTGGGGDEFFDPSYSAPVSSIVDFARAVERATALPPDELRELGITASHRILSTYGADGLRADLERAYRPLVVA